MRLNSDCIRDILLAVEDESDFNHSMEYYKNSDSNNSRLKKYSHDEVIYHINQCKLSGLLLNVHFYDGAVHITIGDLSPEGHKFLSNIREDNIWNGVKSVAKKVGSTSLSALTQIASNVITELIKAQFQITFP